jgi:alpha-tubulin suppressor-like RCC1 family protein
MLVSGGHNFSQISAGFDHSCGVTAAGAILCWGSGADGKIGDPTQQIRFEPFPVM